jgi:protein SMG6
LEHGQQAVLDSLSEQLCLDAELNELRERRRVLKLRADEQERRAKTHESLVDASAQRRLELEIRPKFIVPDTNCFVDHLDLIDKLLATSYYIVVVPLLVINELDKLARLVLYLLYPLSDFLAILFCFYLFYFYFIWQVFFSIRPDIYT